jgi:RimJ/RimL family protein N-acetyltransferase
MPVNRSGQKPMNGQNTANRNSNLGGQNKKKKDAIAYYEKTNAMQKSFKEKELAEKKKAMEKKLADKKKYRLEAKKLAEELGFIEPEAEKVASAEENMHVVEKIAPPSGIDWIHGNLSEYITINSIYYMKKWSINDVQAYFNALEISRLQLELTLPISAVPKTIELAKEKIEYSLIQWDQHEAYNYFIWARGSGLEQDEEEDKVTTSTSSSSSTLGMNSNNDIIVGAIALFNRHDAGTLESGYWVSHTHWRLGISTRANLELMKCAFDSFNSTLSLSSTSSLLSSLSITEASRAQFDSLVEDKEVDASDEIESEHESEGKAKGTCTDTCTGSSKVDLYAIEIYHDKFNEMKSGGVARKIGFIREKEIPYVGDGGAPCSGKLVKWKFHVDNRKSLDLEVGVGVKATSPIVSVFANHTS